MPLASTTKTISRIRALKIQGAENVARAAVKALAAEARASKAGNKREFVAGLQKTGVLLKAARPTEPALRNALRFVVARVLYSDEESVAGLKALVAQQARDYEKESLQVKLKIAEYGARIVPKKANVLIHCHSSTVMRVLKKAFDSGKNPHVYCCEARPLYQGRISAAELSSYGLKVTLTIDNAVNTVLGKMSDEDVVFVGADAITSSGDLVNKTGTSGLAVLAREHDKRFYCCTGTHKFDPLTLWGADEPIEERGPEEVLSKAEAKRFNINPKKLKIINPAFDLTPARYIKAFVTEHGVIPPASLLGVVWKEYGLGEERD